MAPEITKPFTFHWNAGEIPPLVIMVEKETDVPAHTGLADAVMEMPTGCPGITIRVMALEVEGFPVTQVALDVKLHVTTSLFTGEQE